MADLVSVEPEAPLETIVNALVETGYCYLPAFLEESDRAELENYARQCWQSGEFHEAGVGRAAGQDVRPEIRSDNILWVSPDEPCPAVQRYLAFIETLRLALNRALFIGAFNFEGHLALYPEGSFYKRHLDCFAQQPRRCVTCILYLSENWSAADGGALRVYTGKDGSEEHTDFLPQGGALMVFLSEIFEHEVLPTNRERLSLTGWLCRSDGQDFLR